MSRFLLLCISLLSAFAVAGEPGVTEKSITIGQSISLEQGKNVYGEAAARGARLYFDSVNAEGGVHGRKIIVKLMDDDGKNATAAQNARQLIADGVFLLFGSIEGGPSTAVAEVATELKVPFFGPMAGSPTLRRPHLAYVFPVRAEHREEFRALMAWGKATGMTNVGFFRSDTAVGKAHLENVRLIANELGMKVALDVPFKSDVSDVQLDDMVRMIGQGKLDMVINHGSSGVYQRLILKARSAGLKTVFMGVNSGSTQIVEKLGPSAHGMVFSQVVPNPRSGKHPITREFVDAARKAGMSEPLSFGNMEGYLTAKALVAVLRANGPALTREGLIRTMDSFSADLGGLSVRWKSNDHEGSRYVDLSMVGRDGRFVD